MTAFHSSPNPDQERHQRTWRARPARWRVWVVAFSISALLHVAFLFFYGIATNRFSIPAVGFTQSPEREITLQGTEVIRIREVPEEQEDRPRSPTDPRLILPVSPLPPVEARAPAVSQGREDEPRELEEEITVITNADRLRPPEEGDPRIWRFVDPSRGELSDAEKYQIVLWWRLASWYDSLGAATEAERRSLDWTFTDDEGRKWGVAPGKLYLGNITLPLPELFSTPASQYMEVQERIREWEDIERGAQTQAVWKSWREQAEEIRARMDRERADTTRSGGGGRDGLRP